jgi:hypothetical protein
VAAEGRAMTREGRAVMRGRATAAENRAMTRKGQVPHQE